MVRSKLGVISTLKADGEAGRHQRGGMAEAPERPRRHEQQARS
jgi:hypothetical protein